MLKLFEVCTVFALQHYDEIKVKDSYIMITKLSYLYYSGVRVRWQQVPPNILTATHKYSIYKPQI